MPNDSIDPPQTLLPPTVEQQIAQQRIQTHFEFRSALRNIRAQLLLFTSDGPLEPTLGGMILHELESMIPLIRSAIPTPPQQKEGQTQ